MVNLQVLLNMRFEPEAVDPAIEPEEVVDVEVDEEDEETIEELVA